MTQAHGWTILMGMRMEIHADVPWPHTQTNRESRTMLPHIAFSGFASRYSEPSVSEGFVEITKIDFQVGLPFDFTGV